MRAICSHHSAPPVFGMACSFLRLSTSRGRVRSAGHKVVLLAALCAMHAARIVSHGCDADEWPCCTVWAISATTLVAEGAVKIGCEKLLSRRFFPCCRCRAPCEKPAVRKVRTRVAAEWACFSVGTLLMRAGWDAW